MSLSRVCEHCGKELERHPKPCPDDIPGCAVFHFRLLCPDRCEYVENENLPDPVEGKFDPSSIEEAMKVLAGNETYEPFQKIDTSELLEESLSGIDPKEDKK